MIIVFFKTRLFLGEIKAAFPHNDYAVIGKERELVSFVGKNIDSDTLIVAHAESVGELKDKRKLLLAPQVYFLMLLRKDEEEKKLDGLPFNLRIDFVREPYSLPECQNKIRKTQHLCALNREVVVLSKEAQEKEDLLQDRFFVDYLTGSYNYHYLVSKVSFCLQKLKSEMLPLVFIMLDIDSFQRIEDTHGYAFGEEILRQLSAFIRSQVRTSDILIRSGGEEFILLLPHTSRKQGVFVARKLKAQIEHQRFGAGTKKITIRVSMGVSLSTPRVPHTVKALLKQAQTALKHSKMQGGSSVSVNDGSLVLDIEHMPDHALKKLRGKVYDLQEKVQQDLIEMIYGFARIIEAKDFYTGKHVEDTSYIAERIAEELRLSRAKKENIRHAAILHDLGKVGIDQNILLKKGKFSADERKKMQKHPIIAAETLKYIKALKKALPAILYHHERYDGKGYPFRLKGEEIPIEARVVAVADVYQALTSDRPYRKAFSKEQAITIIRKERGSHFDPRVVDAFLKAIHG